MQVGKSTRGLVAALALAALALPASTAVAAQSPESGDGIHVVDGRIYEADGTELVPPPAPGRASGVESAGVVGAGGQCGERVSSAHRDRCCREDLRRGFIFGREALLAVVYRGRC